MRQNQPKSIAKQYEQEMEQSYKVENNQNSTRAQEQEEGPYNCDPVEEFEIGDEGIDELNTIGIDIFLIKFELCFARFIRKPHPHPHPTPFNLN